MNVPLERVLTRARACLIREIRARAMRSASRMSASMEYVAMNVVTARASRVRQPKKAEEPAAFAVGLRRTPIPTKNAQRATAMELAGARS